MATSFIPGNELFSFVLEGLTCQDLRKIAKRNAVRLTVTRKAEMIKLLTETVKLNQLSIRELKDSCIRYQVSNRSKNSQDLILSLLEAYQGNESDADSHVDQDLDYDSDTVTEEPGDTDYIPPRRLMARKPRTKKNKEPHETASAPVYELSNELKEEIANFFNDQKVKRIILKSKIHESGSTSGSTSDTTKETVNDQPVNHNGDASDSDKPISDPNSEQPADQGVEKSDESILTSPESPIKLNENIFLDNSNSEKDLSEQGNPSNQSMKDDEDKSSNQSMKDDTVTHNDQQDPWVLVEGDN